MILINKYEYKCEKERKKIKCTFRTETKGEVPADNYENEADSEDTQQNAHTYVSSSALLTNSCA